eukprot:scaffold42898_cov17-Tisochrysis_lutea.AAC.1
MSLPEGGLSSGFRTKKGQAVEAGMKGECSEPLLAARFKLSKDQLIEELNLPEWPLTDCPMEHEGAQLKRFNTVGTVNARAQEALFLHLRSCPMFAGQQVGFGAP